MTPSGTKAGPEVKVGQIWCDNDKRCAGRLLRVEAISPDSHFAYCSVKESEDWSERRTRIAIKRMRPTSTGYALVKEAE